MIIRFSISNFRSFREPTTLLLTASAERQHRERLPQHGILKAAVLPAAVIYGANAAGKSNLTAALGFLKELVTRGTKPQQPLQRQPFKLGKSAATEPTRFEIDLIATDDQPYRYILAITDHEIVHEELAQIRPTTETILFSRMAGEQLFDLKGLERLAKNAERRQFLRFIAEGTRSNQPFLAEALERGIHELAPVLTWFSACLEVIGPDARPITLEEILGSDDDFRAFLLDRLKAADTGIVDLETEDRLLDEVDELPRSLRESIRSELRENEIKLLSSAKSKAVRFLIRYRSGEIHACRIRALHQNDDGPTVAFDPEDESDGTHRYMDLALAFYALGAGQSRSVFVIDELDRSLHAILIREVIESFLSGCGSTTRSQLIATTHDVPLMTQEVFRRDEIWLAEKTHAGHTTLHSLGEFKDLRSDKELRRNYLQGRFGGVPVVRRIRARATEV